MNNEIILASSSPRRKAYLERYNVKFNVIESEIDEMVNQNENPEQVVMSLAFEKAIYVAGKCNMDATIIAADTVVYANEILGKPKNREEAKDMLKSLSGKEHSVYTGIAVVNLEKNKKIIEFDETKVLFNFLTDDEIESYLDTNEYIDKAGAYGIQGYGEILVDRIQGSYSNVVGLPISKLNSILKKHFEFDLLKQVNT